MLPENKLIKDAPIIPMSKLTVNYARNKFNIHLNIKISSIPCFKSKNPTNHMSFFKIVKKKIVKFGYQFI